MLSRRWSVYLPAAATAPPYACDSSDADRTSNSAYFFARRNPGPWRLTFAAWNGTYAPRWAGSARPFAVGPPAARPASARQAPAAAATTRVRARHRATTGRWQISRGRSSARRLGGTDPRSAASCGSGRERRGVDVGRAVGVGGGELL